MTEPMTVRVRLYRVRDEFLNEVQAWGGDDGGSGCYLEITAKEYNNQWIDFRFEIDPGYTCSSDCWPGAPSSTLPPESSTL